MNVSMVPYNKIVSSQTPSAPHAFRGARYVMFVTDLSYRLGNVAYRWDRC